MSHRFLSLGETWPGCFDQCGGRRKHGLGNQKTYFRIPDLSLIIIVTWTGHLTLRSLQFLICKTGMIIAPFKVTVKIQWSSLQHIAKKFLFGPTQYLTSHRHLIYAGAVLTFNWVYNWAFWNGWDSALFIKTYKKVVAYVSHLCWCFPSFCWEVSPISLIPDELFSIMC